MYKVFLVEDEIIVRDGLKAIIPWQQYGFTLVGDAADGEMALPRIRQLQPDVLITDIRMPFMDGLSLAKIVRAEFPKMHILIASGYDDFEFAQKAIELRVDQYLLKPITKKSLLKVLTELKEKMDAAEVQAGYYERFKNEAQEYEQFARRSFFEKLVEGKLSVEEIYEKAARLHLDLTAPQYNIVQFLVQQESSDQYFEPLTTLQEELISTINCCPEYLLFRWNLSTYAVLVKGSERDIAENTRHCVESLAHRCEAADKTIQWYIAAGQAVPRLSQLPNCFSAVSKKLAYRFLYPKEHLVTEHQGIAIDSAAEESRLRELNTAAIDPQKIVGFLQTGLADEVENFTAEYLDSIGETALGSVLFSQYVLLNVRFTASSYVESLGLDKERLMQDTQEPENELPVSQIHTLEQMRSYVSHLLCRAIQLREENAAGRYRDVMEKIKIYIEQNYTNESFSLHEVARAVNLSSSYFSALFSQEMHKTLTEYVTEKRMQKACELLRSTELRSSEIAFACGYKDPHYFSFLFKKMQGCTPRDYRAGGRT